MKKDVRKIDSDEESLPELRYLKRFFGFFGSLWDLGFFKEG